MTDTPPPVDIFQGDPSLIFGYPLLLDQLATTTYDADTGVHNYAVDFEEDLQYQVEITVAGDALDLFNGDDPAKTLDPMLEMERADGTILGGTYTLDGNTLRYTFIADETSTWLLRISDDGLDDFYNQTYSVRVIETDWIADNVDTRAEFNGGGVIDNGAVFISATDYLGDEDWIRMYLEEGVDYGFFLGGYNPAYDPRLTIYDETGEIELKRKHEFNKITSYNYTPEESGVYYFEARDNLGNDMGAYIAGVYSRGEDSLEGSSGDDVVVSGGGDDWVVTFGGSDTIYGGAGNDTVNGGSGADNIEGGAGDDSLVGGGQTDSLDGAGGSDTVSGGGGSDTLNGGAGEDTLFGGSNGDEINGGGSDDELNGNKGRDELEGGNGDDTLFGNGGADTLDGGNGNDELKGNAGTDVFLFLDGWGDDIILDFEEGDLILFAGVAGLNTIDDLTIEEDDDDMILSYGGDSVTILDAVGVINLDDIDVLVGS